jgi:hypothetical protein
MKPPIGGFHAPCAPPGALSATYDCRNPATGEKFARADESGTVTVNGKPVCSTQP